MDSAVFDSIEREIDDEARARFPGDVVKQAVLLHYGDDPESSRGSCGSGSSCEPTGPRTMSRSSARSRVIIRRRWMSSRATWPRRCARSGWSSSPFPLTPSPAGATVPGAT